MRIHWFSPCLPERTDIGHYTLRVCEVLKEHCDLTLWTHPKHFKGRKQPDWRKRFKAHPYTEVSERIEVLNRADAVFFNLGNNAAFHREILDIMRQVSGVAIVHDRNLFECISSVYREKPLGELRFSQLLEVTYGEQAKNEYQEWKKSKLPSDEIVSKYPFHNHSTQGTWGAIYHTKATDCDEALSDSFPNWTLPLPYPAEPLVETPKLREIDGFLHCVLFGYLGGHNRRLTEILKALSKYPNKDRLRLHLAGEIHKNFKIDSLLKELQLTNIVTKEGFLPEIELDRLLRGCDAVINLRYPTRGEASGSLLRAWNQSAPSIVTNRATYAELPDSVVWKIDPKDEEAELARIWDELLSNPQNAIEKGLAGRKLLETKYNVKSYVQSLLEIAATPEEARAPSSLALLEQRYGLFAHELFQLPPEAAEPILRPIDRELKSWLG